MIGATVTGESMATAQRVRSAMRQARFYGLPEDTAIEVRETHASTVFLAGDRAYKVKKPVRLPFLDYGTLARRGRLCDEEVRVNRRFAPDTYLGVRTIVPAGAGFELDGTGAANAVEYAVEMRRFDEARTLDRLVSSGGVDERLIERVGRRIADLHGAAQAVPGGGPEEISRRIADNFVALRRHVPVVQPAALDAVVRHAQTFAAANRELFSARAAAGRVRDGHGDLRAEHILIENGIAIVDAIEFDERLRQIDVGADLAFLVMDLERLAAHDLAEALVRSYVEASGDAGVRVLVPFFASYRACVRAAVGCIRLDELEQDAPARPAVEDGVRSFMGLALRFAWRSRLPLALVVCGVAGSGKSTLALALERRSGLTRVSSDAIRKELAGLAPEQRGGAGLYSDAHTVRTYEELARRAAGALRDDGGVIVDATFHRSAQRQVLADAMAGTGARVLYCECRAPDESLRSRSRARERAPEHGSDATWQVIEGQLRAFEPLDDVRPENHIVIDTGRPPAESLAELESRVSAAVDRLPRG